MLVEIFPVNIEFSDSPPMEIMTDDVVVRLLRTSRLHVCELANDRPAPGDVRENPLPVVRFGRSVRFRRSDVEEWVAWLAAPSKGRCPQQ
jgi:predicted DNA-binding transcriptional regulator AlpA